MAMSSKCSFVSSFRGIGLKYSSATCNRTPLLRCSPLLHSYTSVQSKDHLSPWQSHLGMGMVSRFMFSCSTFMSCNNADVIQRYDSQKHVKDQQNLWEHYPTPAATLNEIKKIVEARLNLNKAVSLTYKVTSDGYACTVLLKWPDHQIFSGEGRRKKTALAKASLKALCWLLENKHIDKKGRPVFQANNTILASLSEDSLTTIDNVLNKYFEEVIPALEVDSVQSNELASEADKNPNHPILGIPFPSTEDLNNWSQHLLKSHAFPLISELPVENYRHLILETIRNSRVTIVKGETGCGKSTKIPQFILDEAISTGNGAFCNIAVSQPRRITALALAKRIAEERNESVGSCVGHAVKFNVQFPRTLGGSIMFFTAGKLTQTFISNPSLEGVSHVILDEAHLRDTQTDMLMTLMKTALRLNENLKLVIMSATINSDVFTSFYKTVGNVSKIEIPGRTFPVKSYFLNDLPQSVVCTRSQSTTDPHIDTPFVAEVIKWLHQVKPDGAILVFVSGWSDMVEIGEFLSKCGSIFVTPVHSMLQDNSIAFLPPPHGQRKVILATNIAETSLTFPDVVYVVDCGVHKIRERNPFLSGGWSSSKNLLTWISKASVMQRKGRAGRVLPGESFHLFPHEKFDTMRDFELPRIFTDDLEDVIFNMKMVVPDEKAVDLLEKFPSPPRSKCVVNAVKVLQNANLLTLEDEQPTPLAKIVSQISASLPSAISLVYGALFRCLNMVLPVVACAEANVNYCSSVRGRNGLKTFKQKYHKSSDHIANGKALLHLSNDQNSSPMIRNAMYLKQRMTSQILSIIHGKKRCIASDVNVNENNHETLVKCVLLHSPCSLLTLKYGMDLRAGLFGENGMAAALRTGSVNYPVNEKHSGSRLFIYLTGHSVGKVILVDEATAVSPLSVLLFLRRGFSITEKGTNVEIKASKTSEVNIVVSSELLMKITNLREALQTMMDYFVSTELSGKSGSHDSLMNGFRRELLDCFTKILSESCSEDIQFN